MGTTEDRLEAAPLTPERLAEIRAYQRLEEQSRPEQRDVSPGQLLERRELLDHIDWQAERIAALDAKVAKLIAAVLLLRLELAEQAPNAHDCPECEWSKALAEATAEDHP